MRLLLTVYWFALIVVIVLSFLAPGSYHPAAALLGQAQGFGTECRIVLEASVGFWHIFHDEGKIPPNSVRPN